MVTTLKHLSQFHFWLSMSLLQISDLSIFVCYMLSDVQFWYSDRSFLSIHVSSCNDTLIKPQRFASKARSVLQHFKWCLCILCSILPDLYFVTESLPKVWMFLVSSYVIWFICYLLLIVFCFFFHYYYLCASRTNVIIAKLNSWFLIFEDLTPSDLWVSFQCTSL